MLFGKTKEVKDLEFLLKENYFLEMSMGVSKNINDVTFDKMLGKFFYNKGTIVDSKDLKVVSLRDVILRSKGCFRDNKKKYQKFAEKYNLKISRVHPSEVYYSDDIYDAGDVFVLKEKPNLKYNPS